MTEPLFSPFLEKALELAAQWHDATYRKNRWREPAFDVPPEQVLGVPVIAHVTTVAMILQRGGWDETTVAAALLHDALEDDNRYGESFRHDQMVAYMGEAVTLLVSWVTEKKFDGEGQFRSWRQRKEDYVSHLQEAPVEAVAISLADKLHNAWSMNESLAKGIDIFTKGPNRKALRAGSEDQLWLLKSVLEGSKKHADPRLVPLRNQLSQEIARFEWLAPQDV